MILILMRSTEKGGRRKDRGEAVALDLEIRDLDLEIGGHGLETGGPDLETENPEIRDQDLEKGDLRSATPEDLNLEAETTGEVKIDPEAEKAAQEAGQW